MIGKTRFPLRLPCHFPCCIVLDDNVPDVVTLCSIVVRLSHQEGKVCEEYAHEGQHNGLIRIIWQMNQVKREQRHAGPRNPEADLERQIHAEYNPSLMQLQFNLAPPSAKTFYVH